MTARRRPPLWLAAACVASGWGAVYSVARWILLFAAGPVHEDLRYTYVAAEAGLRYGWSTIYDPATLAALSASFPASARHIGGSHDTYVNPPLLAWLFAPFTLVPEPAAYALWTVTSLGALVLAWHVAAPYSGLRKLTLLLLAIALWPLLLSFYFGQPDMLVIALTAVSWWCCSRNRPVAAGIALAGATFLKPQNVALVPLVLLASGRYRPAASWAGACAALTAISVIALGSAGLVSWWHTVQRVQADPVHLSYTLAQVFGLGPVTYILWALQGIVAMFVAVRRRHELEIVFAAGILGSTAVAFHFHELDYSNLVLAAWLVLRTAPSLAHRLWLLAGIVPMQVMTFQASEPNLALVAPQLAWDAGWLAILAYGGLSEERRGQLRDLVRLVVDSKDAQEEAREYRLHAQRQQHRRGNHLAHGQAGIEVSESGGSPAQHGDHEAREAEDEHRRADGEPGLQLDVAEHHPIRRVGRMEALLHGEDFREDGEDH